MRQLLQAGIVFLTSCSLVVNFEPPQEENEQCGDSLDNDGDGATDCADDSCTDSGPCLEVGTECTDTLDNDGDGATDCDDSDCAGEVACQNQPPTATNDTFATDEDIAFSLDVSELLSNDTDPDKDTLTVQSVQAALNGTAVFDQVAGTILVTPDADFNGDLTFTYTINDGNQNTDTATATVTVAAVNDPPAATDDTAATNEDTPLLLLQVDLISNDTDVDPDSLRILGTQNVQNGAVTFDVNGDLTFTPDENFNGPTSFEYLLDDGAGGQDIGLVSLDVAPVNDAPTANAASVQTDEDTSLDITLTGDDVDQDPLTFIVTNPPLNGQLSDPGQGSLVTYVPDPDSFGADSFTFLVDDGSVPSAEVTVTIDVIEVNDLPAAVADTASVNEDGAVIVDALDNDTGLGDGLLAVNVLGQPSQGLATVNPDNTILYRPFGDFFGEDNFTYEIVDSDLETSTATVTIIVSGVDDLPAATADAIATDEDTPISANVLANDDFGDNNQLGDQPIVISIVGQANNGVASVDPATNQIDYTPNADFNGNDSYTYQIQDVDGDTATAVVSVTVNSVNDLPDAINDSVGTNQEQLVSIPVLNNDLGLGDGGVVVSLQTPPSNGSATINGDQIDYTPNIGFNGTDTLTYQVQDAQGESDIATVSILVDDVDDQPEAFADSESTNEDAAVTTAVLANDLRLLDGVITVTIETAPAKGTLVVNPDNTVTYTPNADLNGSDSYVYRVTDADGDFDTATVTLDIVPQDDLPLANNDSDVVNEDSSVVTSVLDNDALGDNPGLGDQPVTVTAGAASNGSVSVNGAQITYTPNADFFGVDSYTYQITDADGDTDTATVSITITGVNDVPIAADDSSITDEETEVLIDVLGNDIFGDNPVIGDQPITLSIALPPSDGVASVVGGAIRYIPNLDFFGTDVLLYQIQDGNGDIDTATVSITVNNLNDAPTANNQAASVNENSLNNTITLTGNDVDGDSLTFFVIDGPFTGTLGAIVPTSATSATVTYTPNANFDGIDSFRFRVNDGTVDSGVGTVTITVNNVPRCNDGAVDAGEECDDGNNVDLDGCESDCSLICGNGSGADRAKLDGGHCYLGFPGSLSTWEVAEASCESLGGYLAVIESGAENDIARSVSAFNEETWIGFHDILAEAGSNGAGFVKVTGGAILGGFQFFAPSQPDNSTGVNTIDGEDCAHFFSNTSLWNDAPCDTSIAIQGHICELEPVSCGDGVLQVGPGFSEGCDDGNRTNGDGCSAACAVEVGFACTTATSGAAHISPSSCVAICGDGLVVSGEGCDDGDTTNGDGCSAQCVVEAGFTCVGQPSVCNRPPVANNDAVNTNEDIAVTISVLTNDTDDAGNVISIDNVSGAINGAAVISGNNVIFTPNTNFSGTGRFSYQARDNFGAVSNTAQVTVTIIAVADQPNLTANNVSGNEDTAIPLSISSSLVDNDGSESLVIVLSGIPAGSALSAGTIVGGSASLTQAQLTGLRLTPPLNFNGPINLTATATATEASNGNQASRVANFTVTVNAVNDPPVAVDDAASTNEDTAVTIPVLGNDTDVDGPTLSISSVQNALNGTPVISGNNVIFTPTADFNGTASFDYTISDGVLFDTGAVIVTVNTVNDAPFFNAITNQTVNEDAGTQNVSITGISAGPANESSQVVVLSAVSSNASIVPNPSVSAPSGGNATLTYTPASDGTVTITVTATDNGGTANGGVNTFQRTFTITVNNVLCGDRIISGNETCDDGNAISGDGCSNICRTEDGFVCNGQPSICVPAAPCNAAAHPGASGFVTDPTTGHCFAGFVTGPLNWFSAQANCESQGGYLASPDSAAENDLARGALGNADIWLGVNDINVEAGGNAFGFIRVTGAGNITFNGFRPGEPNNSGDEDCAIYNFTAGDELWNDFPCGNVGTISAFICEFEDNPCGDGVVQSAFGEQCDDRNNANGDGCSSTCLEEGGFTCTNESPADGVNNSVCTAGAFCHDIGFQGCPTGATQYCDSIPIDRFNRDQAREACEACLGVACLETFADCAGGGWGQNGDAFSCGEPYWGYQDGCSGEAGRVWSICSSFDTFGRWAP